MNKKCYTQVTRCLLIGLLALCSPVLGVAATPSSEGEGEDQALTILRQASAHLTQTKQFRFTSDTEYLINPGSDQQIVFRASQDISIQRPNRAFGLVQRQNERKRRIWYDGKTMSVLEEPDQVYSTLTVPETIDATLDYLIDHDFVLLPLVNLLYSDLSFMETQAESWRYVGEEMLGEVRCHRLAFQGPESEGELWIEVGDKPLFRKAVVTYPQQEGQPQFTAHIHHWEIGLDLPEAQFVFIPPEGAKHMPVAALAPPTK